MNYINIDNRKKEVFKNYAFLLLAKIIIGFIFIINAGSGYGQGLLPNITWLYPNTTCQNVPLNNPGGTLKFCYVAGDTTTFFQIVDTLGFPDSADFTIQKFSNNSFINLDTKPNVSYVEAESAIGDTIVLTITDTLGLNHLKLVYRNGASTPLGKHTIYMASCLPNTNQQWNWSSIWCFNHNECGATALTTILEAYEGESFNYKFVAPTNDPAGFYHDANNYPMSAKLIFYVPNSNPVIQYMSPVMNISLIASSQVWQYAPPAGTYKVIAEITPNNGAPFLVGQVNGTSFWVANIYPKPTTSFPTSICLDNLLYKSWFKAPGSNESINVTSISPSANVFPVSVGTGAYKFSAPGTYTFTVVRSSFGCADITDTYTLNVTMNPSFQNPAPVCPNTYVALNGTTCVTDQTMFSGISWLWDFGDGTTEAGQSVHHKYTASGTYNITLKLTYNGYTETITKTITINPLPQFAIVGNNNDCSQTATYTVDNPDLNSSYDWSTLHSGNYTGTSPSITWQSGTECPFEVLTLTVTDNTTSCSNTKTMNIYSCCTINETSPQNVLNNATLSSNASYSGYVNINGNLVIDADVSFTDAYIYLSPDSKITVNPGATITIDGSVVGDRRKCCHFMWDGIYTENPTATINITNSTVTNAKRAVVSKNGGVFHLSNTNFENNNTGVAVYDYYEIETSPGSGANMPDFPGTILGCNFYRLANSIFTTADNTGSQYGIYVNKVRNFTIGDPQQAKNQFYDIGFGIYNINSDIKVYNNEFKVVDNVNYAQTSGIYSIYKYTEMPAQPTNINHELIVGGISTSLKNTFTNLISGITSFGQYVDVRNNDLVDCYNGIEITNLRSYSKVSSNTVSRTNLTAVSPGTAIKVQRSHVDVSGFTVVDVAKNVISNYRNGIWLINIQSVKPINRIAKVEDNTINYFVAGIPGVSGYTVTTDYQNGIIVDHCNSIFVSNNKIVRNRSVLPSVEAELIKGITVRNTQGANIQENYINNMGSGIFTAGPLTKTMFTCNKFDHPYYGFNFGMASGLTDQGWVNASTAPQNFNVHNRWIGFFNPGQEKIKACPGCINTIPWPKWYYNDNLGIEYDINPSQVYSQADFLPSNNATTNCAVNNPPYVPSNEPVYSQDPREVLYGQIVRDQLFYNYLNDLYKEYDRGYLFDILRNAPDIMNKGDINDNLYLSFYNSVYNSEVQTILAARERMFSHDNEQAKAFLNNITPDDKLKWMQRQVDEVYMDTWNKDIYEFTPAQYQTLFGIATITPYEGGEAVYTARVMLGIDPDTYQLYYSPNPIHKTEKELEAKVYPNPASKQLTVSFSGNCPANSKLKLYNMLGIEVAEFNLTPNSTKTELNTESLKPGMYYYHVVSNDKNIDSGKLMIIK